MTTSLLLFLFYLIGRGATTLYTADTGQCTGGVSPDNEAGKVIHSTSSCRELCTSDHTCTGYNVKSSSDSWCLTYYSKHMHAVKGSKYSSWTCFRKETDYDVVKSVCWNADTTVSPTLYQDRNCEARCDRSDTCTGFAIGNIDLISGQPNVNCMTYTTENIAGFTTSIIFDNMWSCAVRKRTRYTFILKTGSVGTNFANRMALTVFGSKGSVVPDTSLTKPGFDLPSRYTTEYTWTMRDVGEVEKIRVAWTTGEGRWCPDYIAIVTDRDPIPALYRTKNSKDCATLVKQLGKETIEFFPSSS